VLLVGEGGVRVGDSPENCASSVARALDVGQVLDEGAERRLLDMEILGHHLDARGMKDDIPRLRYH
jgi:hypothetical protein